jgi:excisionase family DNA binding protein
MQRLLTIEEAAEILGIKVGTLYKWCCARKIVYKKIGSSLRFDPDELEAWIREQTVEPLIN